MYLYTGLWDTNEHRIFKFVYLYLLTFPLAVPTKLYIFSSISQRCYEEVAVQKQTTCPDYPYGSLCLGPANQGERTDACLLWTGVFKDLECRLYSYSSSAKWRQRTLRTKEMRSHELGGAGVPKSPAKSIEKPFVHQEALHWLVWEH